MSFLLLAVAAFAADYPTVNRMWHQRSVQAGDTLTATDTSEKGPFVSSLSVPANLVAGCELCFRADGSGSTLPGGGNLTFRLKLGSVVLWTSQAYTSDNTVWYVTASVRCETGGASGSAIVNVRNGTGPGTSNFTASSGVATTVNSIDWTAQATLGLTAQWSVANAGHVVKQLSSCVSYVY